MEVVAKDVDVDVDSQLVSQVVHMLQQEKTVTRALQHLSLEEATKNPMVMASVYDAAQCLAIKFGELVVDKAITIALDQLHEKLYQPSTPLAIQESDSPTTNLVPATIQPTNQSLTGIKTLPVTASFLVIVILVLVVVILIILLLLFGCGIFSMNKKLGNHQTPVVVNQINGYSASDIRTLLTSKANDDDNKTVRTTMLDSFKSRKQQKGD